MEADVGTFQTVLTPNRADLETAQMRGKNGCSLPISLYPSQAGEGMASIRARASVRQHLSSDFAQTEDLAGFAAGQQPALGCDLGAVKLELEAAAKRQPEHSVLRFT